MADRIDRWPACEVRVDAKDARGPLELWRHSLGHGGINAVPLPRRVIDGAARLQPPLVRIFIQEFFRIYRGGGTFDWSRLDPYMAAFAATGAKVVAAICIKPQALYPEIDHRLWRPADVPEWQRVIGQLVRRYSVDQPLVTHWEMGNEVDIGEDGGSPYLVTDPAEYLEYYQMTLRPILEVFPEAKVGGTASASVHAPSLTGFVELCKATGTRLDFISYHLYSSDPVLQAECARAARAMADGAGNAVETMVTEFSSAFETTSTQDQAFAPHRAAAVATAILTMMEAGIDWSFYYHLWDQVCYPEDFQPFFSAKGVAAMVRHWNEIPHRFGLFGVDQEVRPQYFLYRMLHEMGDRRLVAASDHQDLRVLAGSSGRNVQVMLVNFNVQAPADRVAVLKFVHLTAGAKRLTVYRIDSARRWFADSLDLVPVETRDLWASEKYECHVAVPAGCVAMACLDAVELA